jgi:ABC-type nitrate/sulfonate/bicarbonate transport system permease component
MTRFGRYGLGLLGVASFLVVWEIAGLGLGSALLAPPTEVIPEFVRILLDGSTLLELFQSLQQMFVGYLLAFAVAVPFGVAMGRSQIVDAVLHPWVSMFLVTSVAALVPLIVILFGYGFEFRVAIVFLASVWYMLLTIFQGARGIDPRYLDVARTFTANHGQVFVKVLVPALLPYVLIAARISSNDCCGAVHLAWLWALAVPFGAGHLDGPWSRVALDADDRKPAGKPAPASGLDAGFALVRTAHQTRISLDMGPQKARQSLGVISELHR